MANFRLWPSTDGPGAASIDGTAVSLATEFYITSTGWLTHLWFWRPTTQVTGTITGRVYAVATGTAVSGTDVTFTVSGTGWISAALASPVSLATNTRYRAVVHFPSNYASTTSYWSTGPGGSGITSGILTAPGSGGGPTQSSFQGAFNYGATISFPNNQFSASGYWVDVTVTDTDPGQTPSGTGTAALSLAVSSIGAKQATGTGTASLSMAATHTGAKTGTGTSSANLSLASTAVGTKRATGAATAGLSLAGTPVGAKTAVGAAAAGMSFSGDGVGLHQGTGPGGASLALSASGAGVHRGAGTGTASITLTAGPVQPSRDLQLSIGRAGALWTIGPAGSPWTIGKAGGT